MRALSALGRIAGSLVLVVFLSGCATVAEQRKLEHELNQVRQQNQVAGDPRSRHAELSARVDALQAEVQRLEGRVEVAEHQAKSALEEARAAREDAYASRQTTTAADEPAVAPAPASATATELAEYRKAYGAWRGGDTDACIDRFRGFLQTFPSSEYADDATYWMADCYLKQGDLKTAILRFDDVAGRYPNGNKAADALFRQGEALLKLGPNYGTAARKAFERVISEYPDSPRAQEAKGQIDLLQTS